MRENPCIIISWLAARRADGVWCISKAWNFILFLVIVKFHEIFMSLRWRFSFLSQVCKYEIKLLEGRRNWGLAKELHYIMTKSKSRRNNWGVLRLLNWNGVYAYLSRLSKTGIKSICRTESLDMQLRSKVQDWMQQTLFLERGYMWLQHPRFTVRGWVLLLLCVYVCVCVFLSSGPRWLLSVFTISQTDVQTLYDMIFPPCRIQIDKAFQSPKTAHTRVELIEVFVFLNSFCREFILRNCKGLLLTVESLIM